MYCNGASRIMEHLIGTTIKGYKLLELIGTGGFGAVYRAHQSVVDREVAIKIILPELANAPTFIRRFETEAQLVARLEHPYIVPLYDYWRDPQGAYLIMRYLRGGSLTGLIKRDGPLNPEQTGRMLNQIAAALAVAHTNGVIHRDLKPDNILLDEAGNHYLSDFGIAKDIGTDVNLTQTGTIIGSPAYLSPEQITGETLTAMSDVYTLGILLHYALTGEHPFPGKTPTAMLVHQMQDPMPPVQVYRDDISDALEEVLQRATAKDPESRYKSVMELAVDFNRALHDPTASTSAVQRLSSSEANMIITGMNTGDNAPNPYKGLKAFEEADAGQFFGRISLTEQLLARLASDKDGESGDNLLVIVGPSGSGKSSVVKAGLIPALRRGALPGSDEWFYADMVPGANPMEEVEAALLRVAVNPPESLLRQLREDERGLVRAIKRVLPDDNTQLVLFIDQFEEVFTLTTSEADRQHFLNSLLNAVNEPRNRLRLIITLRADFYDRPLSYHEFGQLVRQYTEVVLPLSPQELENAIVQPARQVGVALENGLSTAIIADVRDQPGALPLLQYALTQLYDQRENGRLTLDTYKHIGRALGALAQRAETLYNELTPAAQEQARQMFLRLVTLGEGTEDTRRRVTRSELRALGDDAVMQRVIDTFGNQRLLTFDNDPQTREPTIEVAHEALIREWRRLGDWLDSAREDLRTQRRLFQSTQEWLNADRDPSYLAHGTRLEQFEGLWASANIAMNEDEAAYVDASAKARDIQKEREAERVAREEALETAARQRLQLLLVGATLAALVALVLAFFAVRAERGAVEARNNAEQAAEVAQANAAEAKAVALAANAVTLIDNHRPTLALVVALEAAARRPDLTAVQQALAAAAYAPSAVAQLNPLDDVSLVSVGFNADGSRVAAGSADGQLFVLDPATRETLLTVADAHTDADGAPLPVTATAYSRGGEVIATGDSIGTIKLWDATSGTLIDTLTAHDARVTALHFGPNGEQLLSGSNDTQLLLWDALTGEQIRAFEGHVGTIFSADWAWDAGVVVSSTGDSPADDGPFDRHVRVYDVNTGEILLDYAPEGVGWLRATAITPDGSTVAVASYDPNQYGGTIRLVDTATGELRASLYGHTDVITTLDISADGQRAISGGWDQTARVWDITGGVQVQRFDTHSDRILTTRFSPDGSHVLVTAGRDSGTPDDARALYYNLDTLALERTLLGHTDWLWSVGYSADGNLLATGSGHLNTVTGDNTVRLWDTATGRELSVIEGHTNTVNGVDFHPEGELLATGAWDGTVRLWNVSDPTDPQPLVTLAEYETAVNDVDFHPDGEALISAGGDGTVRLYNVATRELIRTIEAHPGQQVSRAKFSVAGDLIATSGRDSMVRVWNVRTGEMVREFAGHTGWVSTVNFDPTGRFVVSGADDNLIIWDLNAPEDNPIYRVLVGHQGFVYGGDFSPDGRYVLSTASDTTVRLWEVETGAEIRRFDDHTNWGLDVEFHPDGTSAATVAEDNTARIWQVAPSTDALIEWVQTNRYVPELTCAQRERYSIEPLCNPLEDGGAGRDREVRGTPVFNEEDS